jgi:hypothetical protein
MANSVTYDTMEAVRPCVDGWLATWLAEARFSKRDFYEEGDGTIRITRPLTSHLAMTAPIWRPATQAVAGWLARAFAGGVSEGSQLCAPLPSLPAPRRAWQGMQPPVPKTCVECGRALSPKQRKFCSAICSDPFRLSLTQRARGWQFNPSRISPIKTGRSAGPYRRDEVDFPMNVSSLAQLRGIFDRSEIGWALIGAAGMERHVARSSWLCSRWLRPLQAEEVPGSTSRYA